MTTLVGYFLILFVAAVLLTGIVELVSWITYRIERRKHN
jgi:hypothetical protein